MCTQYGYSIICLVFSLLLSTNFTNADTIRGVITKDGKGLSGKRVVARQEIIAGYKVGSKPCRSSHPNIQTIATTATDANGTYAISYTVAQQPPGSCFFFAKVYVQVFDGDKLIWTSPKVVARRQVTLSHDFSEAPPATAPDDNLITPADATIIVDNKDSLLAGLISAKSGDIIYIEADYIDLSGEANIAIPDSVTLASGRGNGVNPGVLIHSKDMDTKLFVITGSNVRITGIRFGGPSTRAGADPSAGCISIWGDCRNIEIDHCEFFGWPQYGIFLDDSELPKQQLSSVHIHDNYIHHNLGFNKDTGAGYGVAVYDAYALIERNVFDQNRHAIAAHGDSTSGYEARFNVVLDKNAASEQSFDMHRLGDEDKWGPAGEYVKIHQNTFLYEDDPAFIIRGKPIDKASWKTTVSSTVDQ